MRKRAPDAGEPLPGYEGLLAHAMIAAALANGDIDPEQKIRIVRQVMKAGVDDGRDPRFVYAMAHPWTPRKLAEHCRCEHQRLAVYQAAARIADASAREAAGFLEALYITLDITRAQRTTLHR